MTTSSIRSESLLPSCQHASAEEYTRFIQASTESLRQRRHLLGFRSRFVRSYPDLHLWFQKPLAERVGRLSGEDRNDPSYRVSYEARRYLLYVVLHGYARLDWEWLIAVHRLDILDLLTHLGRDMDIEQLVEEAVVLGYDRLTALAALQWTVGRIFLHTAITSVEGIDTEVLAEFIEAVVLFGERPDVSLFYGSSERYRARRAYYLSYLHVLQVVLYHRGQVTTEPRKSCLQEPRHPVLNPRMEAVIARYLAARRLTDQPSTVAGYEQDLHRFVSWLTQAHPDVETLAGVTREHITEYAEALTTTTSSRTGRPLATLTRRGALSCLSVFFQETARWQWEDGPQRPLLQHGDLPKVPQRVPRYIPEQELARLMQAIRALACPYQRAALLIARWSGARRDEIVRLSLDCLDSYPDGTPRLRLPTGKTYQERMVPIHREAAEAIRVLQAQRKGERGLRDPKTGVMTRYLFMQHGKVLSASYLFTSALQTTCSEAGLLTAEGKPTVTAHRFRHTVGTQLARRQARMRTIMTILGHASAAMTMRYLDITDEEVLEDYQAALEPGAPIAGPAAEFLHAGTVSAADLDWLKCHFFKTELELGHCLRLPEEGPCECDLYLFCAKFLTTRQKAPRLRHRRKVERFLAEDAAARDWMAEVGRHQRFARRCEELLTDLGEPLDGPEAED